MSRMRNTMVKLKMSSILVLLTKQEVPAFSCLQLIDPVPFSKEAGFSEWRTQWWSLKCENGTNQSVTCRKILALPAWQVKQEVTAFFTSPQWFASRKPPSWEKGTNQSITVRKMLTLTVLSLFDVWRFCPSPLEMLSQAHRHRLIVVYNNSNYNV